MRIGEDITVYLASPNSAIQAAAVAGMPVLLSYALYTKWMGGYHPTFRRILIDSGAFSVFNSGKVLDLDKYAEWAEQWVGVADAVAGLDDIAGDWRQSLKNYERFPVGFPTFHETDPPELLDDLVAMAQERKQWLGFGLLPPRDNKDAFVRATLERIPPGIHVHGWALRAYTKYRRFDSVDSTNWWRDAMQIKAHPLFRHLHYGECMDIVVKRYQRESRLVNDGKKSDVSRGTDLPLFGQ